jgi:hypothetical protein
MASKEVAPFNYPIISIPTSLMFALIGDLFDRFISTDAIGYAVQAVKGNDAGSC